MFIHDATRRASQSRTLVISYSIPAIINLVEEYRSRVNSARAVRRRAIIVAILLRDTVKRPSSVSFARNSSTNFLRTHPSAFLISPPPLRFFICTIVSYSLHVYASINELIVRIVVIAEYILRTANASRSVFWRGSLRQCLMFAYYNTTKTPH